MLPLGSAASVVSRHDGYLREEVGIMLRGILVMLALVVALCSCSGEARRNANAKGVAKMSITVKSSAFADGGMIPKKYTADGADVSPPLSWTAPANGVKSYALIVDDPDAPSKVWVHWVAYNLPAEKTDLAENQPKQDHLPNGGAQGMNDMRKIGYNGPAPPSGVHRYCFKIYALDAKLDLKPGATKAELLSAMEGHILAQGQLMGRYTREKSKL